MSTLSFPAVPAWVRLQAALSAVAMVVFAVRSVQTMQMMTSVGAPMPWSRVLITQGAFWIAWSLWAGALVPLVRRIVDHRPAPGLSAVALVALAAAPVLVVPALSLPAHQLTFDAGHGWPASYAHILSFNALTNLLLGATIVGVVYGWLTVERARRLEVTAARLHGQLADARLETLRARLDPHFLFNALNSIAVLARRGRNAEVEQMVTGLAGLLRHSLDASSAQLVTLGVELAALRQYLEIEGVRHGDRLRAVVDVPGDLHGRLVPSLLLQPLVENAVRHGFTGPDTPLRLEVRAAGTPDRVTLTVTDDGAGLDPDAASGPGLGLGNTRARLAGLFGDRASLTLGPGPSGRGTRVVVSIPG